MGRRSRSRSRGGGGGLSRRALLGGGAVAVGGAALVARSGAFSQSTATRGTSVDATGDDEALVGIAVAPSVVAGGDDQELVTITNNASRELSVTVTLSDPDDGEVNDPTATLGPDGEHAFSVSVVQGIETGEGALPFGIEATGDGSFHATMERRADVEEGDGPTLKRNIIDETKDTNAAFTIEYEVESVSDFDRLELDVENTSVGWIDGESFVRHSRDGVISYPSQGTDGGAEGHTYVFTFRVYDSNDQVVLSRSAERVAGEESDDDDDGVGGAGDPEIEWFSVEDDSSPQHGTVLEVDYQVVVDDPDRFGSVRVEFDTDADPGGHWADETITAEGSSGTVTHTRDGTVGSTYEVTVAVKRPSGVTVDSGSVTIESGSNETIDWP